MTIKHTDITLEKLKQFLDLDLETYTFTWKYNPTMRPQWNGRNAGMRAGYNNKAGGIQIFFDGVKYKAHHLVWLWVYGKLPEKDIDHKDGNPLNNHPDNLREATITENARNKKRGINNKSGAKGVWYCKERNKYEVKIKVYGKHHFLGRYNSLEKAKAVYEKAAKFYFGEFARVA